MRKRVRRVNLQEERRVSFVYKLRRLQSKFWEATVEQSTGALQEPTRMELLAFGSTENGSLGYAFLPFAVSLRSGSPDASWNGPGS